MLGRDTDRDELITLIAPWLPDAAVDTLEMQTTCGCYSEFTQDPCYFNVTFRAPRPDDETNTKLSKLVSVLESVIQPWADRKYDWCGCGSCCDEDKTDTTPNVSVRVIRQRSEAGAAADA